MKDAQGHQRCGRVICRLFAVLEAVVCAMGILAAAGLGGCTVGPDYRKPQPEMEARWSEAPSSSRSLEAVAQLARWWTVFNDPELDSLVQRAVESNKDLKLAFARIREARAQRAVVAADAYPEVSVSGGYTRIRRSENAPFSPVASKSDTGPSHVNPASPLEDDLYQAGFDASWELDLFGGIRRAVEAADASIQASEENRRDVLVTLLADVARSYIEVRGAQLRLAIAWENIEAQRKIVELTQFRFDLGKSRELDVRQAEGQLGSLEAVVPVLESQLKQSIHSLGVLLGMPPGTLLEELAAQAPIPSGPAEIPAGLPSELLLRRPDVRQAERQLAAATARVGVATADLFPSFSLLGSVGQESTSLGELATKGSWFWTLGPTVRWPVFDAGRIRSKIKVQDARQEQALITYEQTVLNALKDVESALVAYAKEQTHRDALARTVEANRRAFEIARDLYTSGTTDFLSVLASQGALCQSRDQLAQSEQQVSEDLAALFKALGGGWEAPPPY